MLQRKYRLPVQSVSKQRGKAISYDVATFKFFPSKLLFPRFGVVISKKVSKSAVARNNIKRIIFSVCQKFIDGRMPPHDVLIIVKPSITSLSRLDITNSLHKILSSSL